jgi:hypothetical protein
MHNRILVSAALCIAPALWAQRAPADQVNLYQVPLRCPASRNLGCGSASKPILQAFEKNPKIQEAWLSHDGAVVAIVWKKGTTPDERISQIRAEAEEWHISLPELTGDLRADLLASFMADKAWYRGAEVDQLSAEEANIIAARWVRRAATKVPSIAGKSEVVTPALAKVMRERFTNCDGGPADYDQRLKAAAHKYLSDAEFNALMEAGLAKHDYHPVGDEQ